MQTLNVLDHTRTLNPFGVECTMLSWKSKSLAKPTIKAAINILDAIAISHSTKLDLRADSNLANLSARKSIVFFLIFIAFIRLHKAGARAQVAHYANYSVGQRSVILKSAYARISDRSITRERQNRLVKPRNRVHAKRSTGRLTSSKAWVKSSGQKEHLLYLQNQGGEPGRLMFVAGTSTKVWIEPYLIPRRSAGSS